MKHDVNRYYADLGVEVEASRRRMMEAYQEDGAGDPRRTYVLKQLLDEDLRRRYDALPLGSFLVDRYIEEAFARRMAGLEGVEEDVVDILDETPSSLDNGDFSYYLYRTPCIDRIRIGVFRGKLIQYLGSRKEVYRLAVGCHGSVEPVRVMKLDDHIAVLFADYVDVDEALLAKVASKLQRV
jgi:hypothetical protein